MKNIDAWDLKVTDRKSFEKFLNLLLIDLKKNQDDWENNKLEKFLEAMSRYTSVLDSYYKNMESDSNADIPTWKVFADIMRGAVVYE